MRCYNILLDCIRIKSTDGNFVTHGKVAIHTPLSRVLFPFPFPFFCLFVFPFPWDSRGNKNPIPMHISTVHRMQTLVQTRGLTVDLRQHLPAEAIADADLWSESVD